MNAMEEAELDKAQGEADQAAAEAHWYARDNDWCNAPDGWLVGEFRDIIKEIHRRSFEAAKPGSDSNWQDERIRRAVQMFAETLLQAARYPSVSKRNHLEAADSFSADATLEAAMVLLQQPKERIF